MDLLTFHSILVIIQRSISFCGVLVITIGVALAIGRYFYYSFSELATQKNDINKIRLKLSLVLTLGLEFIVAADLIGTTTAPDYYSIGMVACIVLIRTILSYTLNREINELQKSEKKLD